MQALKSQRLTLCLAIASVLRVQLAAEKSLCIGLSILRARGDKVNPIASRISDALDVTLWLAATHGAARPRDPRSSPNFLRSFRINVRNGAPVRT